MKNIFVGSIALFTSLVLASSAFCQNSIDLTLDGGAGQRPFNADTGLLINPTGRVDISAGGGDGISATANGAASAIVGQGFVGVSASVNIGFGSANGSNMETDAIAQYQDSLTVTKMGPPGALVTVSYAWLLSGGVTSSASVTGTVPPNSNQNTSDVATASLYVSGAGFGNGFSQERWALDATAADNQDPNGNFHRGFPPINSILITFNYVVPADGGPGQLPLSLTLDARASAQGGSIPTNPAYPSSGAASATTNFFHTATWNGMIITDSNGVPITGWTVTSASGFDYSQPFVDVPEPSTFVLLAIALPSLLLASRRYRQNCRS